MRRDEKKQVLNRNKTFVPDETGRTSFEYMRVTSVAVDSGRFYVSVPAHLHNVANIVSAERKVEEEFGLSHTVPMIYFTGDAVYASTKDKAVQDWESLMHRCEQYLKTANRERVIIIRSEMVIHTERPDGTFLNRKDVSFAKVEPLIGIEYEVLYRNGNDLLDEDNRWKGTVEKSVVVPYTEEREAFLKAIVDSLVNAALQIDQFTKLLKRDPLQIETIMKKGFLLENKGSTP